MSNSLLPRARIIAGKRHFAIVASEFNAHFVDGLVNHAMSEFSAQGSRAEIMLMRVPGAFEIPVVVQDIAAGKEMDAIIAIAVILKGETAHAEHLARSVTD